MRYALTLTTLLAASPALGAPVPVTTDPFPAITSQGIGVSLSPFVKIPSDDNQTPIARITTAVSDGTGRIFVSDLTGEIFATTNAGARPTSYLDLRTQNVGAYAASGFYQQGLTGVAFHPNFAGSPALPGYGKFYTTYTIANTGKSDLGDGTGAAYVQVREWAATNPLAPTFSGSSRPVITISGYADEHKNGVIAFNPNARPGTADYGNLYIGSGNGSYNDANGLSQNPLAPQSKLLRINPLQSGTASYTVPGDNPFVGRPGYLPETYASGLRFPQSFSWDLGGSGQLFINDLGQAHVEEVDLGAAGANYGWSQRAGTLATGFTFGTDVTDENVYPVTSANLAYTDPVAEYWHDEGVALGSGFVYRGTAIPGLYGKYVLADIVLGRLFYFDPADAVGGPAPLHVLDLYENGAPISLYDTYYPRADARLAQKTDGELLLLTKAAGEVFSLGAEVAVPEPTSLALLATLLAAGLTAGAVRRR